MQLAASCGVADGERPDVALEVFFRYALFRASIGSPVAIPSWLRTTTFHVAYLFRTSKIARRETPRPPAELQDLGAGPSPEEELSALEEERDLWRLVDDLEADRREVFRRYALQDEPMSAIAAELGIPEGTAYNRLRLAREDLQAALHRGDKVEERTKGTRRFGLFPFLFAWRPAAMERLFSWRPEAMERWRRGWNSLAARFQRGALHAVARPAFHALVTLGVAVGVASIPGDTPRPPAVQLAMSPLEISASAVTAPPDAPDAPSAPAAAEHVEVETGTLQAPGPADAPAHTDRSGERPSPRWRLPLTLAAHPPLPVRTAPLTRDRIATAAARAALESGSLRDAWTRLQGSDTPSAATSSAAIPSAGASAGPSAGASAGPSAGPRRATVVAPVPPLSKKQ